MPVFLEWQNSSIHSCAGVSWFSVIGTSVLSSPLTNVKRCPIWVRPTVRSLEVLSANNSLIKAKQTHMLGRLNLL